jgi:hypothetical protein
MNQPIMPKQLAKIIHDCTTNINGTDVILRDAFIAAVGEQLQKNGTQINLNEFYDACIDNP